ncbi:hypothetical protein Tco_0715186 [Tanacetum coccineum]
MVKSGVKQPLDRNAIGAHYLPHSNEYVAPPSIDVVRHWFLTIRYREEFFAKGTLRKSLLPPRWRLLMAKIIQCLGGKTGGFDQITNKDVVILYSLANGINIDYSNIFWEDIINKLKKKQRENVVPYTRFLSLLIMHKMKDEYGDAKPVVFKAPKLSSNAKRDSQGIKPRAQPGHKKHSTSLKKTSMSSKEATKGGSSKPPTSSKTGHSKKRKESSLAMDSNPSQPPVFSPVDTGMHKEDQQATDVPTSLGVTSEERSYPQLSRGCDASSDSTAEADLGLSAPNDFLPQQQGMDEGTKNTSFVHISEGASSIDRKVEEEESSRSIKLKDLAKLVLNVQTSFKDLNSLEDDHVIVVDDSDEDEEDKVHTNTNHKLELEKNKAEDALLKAQPTFPNVGQLNELWRFERNFTKLEDFTKTVTGLTSQVVKLKTLQWELPVEFLLLPVQVSSVQAKLKTLDALPSLLLNVTKALNKFAQVLDSASSKVRDQSVPSAGQANTMPAEGENNTNQATISQLFQRRAKKNAKKENLNNQQPKPISLIITTILNAISFFQSHYKSSSLH